MVEAVAPGTIPTAIVEDGALHRARVLTESAIALGSPGDEATDHRIGRLHVLAAELKRLNGAEQDCLVNYTALARRFIERREIGAAIAYMRKSMYVADLSPSRKYRMEARFLAAEVYLAAGQGGLAGQMVHEGSCLADELGDPAARTEAKRLVIACDAVPAKTAFGRCPCGQATSYDKCCGLADEMPAEFLVKVYRTRTGPGASPFWSPGSRGIELLMTPPALGGVEHKAWYSWRVESGRHRLMSYPNWTGRALGAARKMAELSRQDEDDTDAPASAVLQSVCALEAFLTAWKFFMREQTGVSSWPGPTKRLRSGRDEQAAPMGVSGLWDRSGRTMFKENWKPSHQAKSDMLALCELRHAIVHSIGDPEQIVPTHGQRNKHVVYFSERNLRLRPAPATWVDRVLTVDVADWAVDVATTQIAQVREAFAEKELQIALEEGMLGIEQDIMDYGT